MERRFEVGGSTAREMAREVTLARLRQPSAVAASAAATLLSGVAAGLTWGAAVGGLVGGLVLVLLGLAALRATTTLTGALQARGFQPGVVMTARWGDDGLTVESGPNRSHLDLTDVQWVRYGRSATTVMLRRARWLLVLPHDLVDQPTLARLAARAAAAGAASAPLVTSARPPERWERSANRSDADEHWRFRD